MLMEADATKVCLYIPLMKLLHLYEESLHLSSQSELLAACQHGNTQTVWHLLQKGADPNCHDGVRSCVT